MGKTPFVIGLTGPTGAGKGLVGEMLRSRRAFEVIDADLAAREAVQKGSPCLQRIAGEFGDILLEDGTLDRKRLASVVFSDEEKLLKLNAVIHPFITTIIRAKLEALKEKGVEAVVLDAPALFESGADSLCDFTVAVIARPQTRLRRIIERDKIDEKTALIRMNAQHDDKYYTDRSDFIIINNLDAKDEKTLSEQVDRMLEKIEKSLEK